MPSVDYDTLPNILILATEACAYPGADYVGQIHAEYSTNTYIVRVPAPVILPEDFHLRCFPGPLRRRSLLFARVLHVRGEAGHAS